MKMMKSTLSFGIHCLIIYGWSSEFEDASQDRQRIPGSLSGFRRTEYGSSPPTRGDSGNYSRGIHGRWDSRSSGRSDRDSDPQSDLDSGNVYDSFV